MKNESWKILLMTNYVFEFFQLKKRQSKESGSEISSSSDDELDADVNLKRKVKKNKLQYLPLI